MSSVEMHEIGLGDVLRSLVRTDSGLRGSDISKIIHVCVGPSTAQEPSHHV